MKLRTFIARLQMPLFLGVLLAIVVVAGVTGFMVGQRGDSAAKTAKTTVEPGSLLAEIDKLYKLPTSEQPTIATIKDMEKLKDQPFFKEAKNGDQIIMYSNAKLALIYRKSEHKLVNVGPINYNEATK